MRKVAVEARLLMSVAPSGEYNAPYIHTEPLTWKLTCMWMQHSVSSSTLLALSLSSCCCAQEAPTAQAPTRNMDALVGAMDMMELGDGAKAPAAEAPCDAEQVLKPMLAMMSLQPGDAGRCPCKYRMPHTEMLR